MPEPSLPYRCICVLGATSGIGRALAKRLHDLPHSPTVIATGRRKENLDALEQEHPGGRLIGRQSDQSASPADLKAWVETLCRDAPDLDAVFLVAGLQNKVVMAEDEHDADEVERETRVNLVNPMHLVAAFLPHFKQRQEPSLIALTTSGLALIPNAYNPYYCASKAGLRSFTISLRVSLEPLPHIKVVEIIPPLVKTELHLHQPAEHQAKMEKRQMPLEDFTDELMQGLLEGRDEIPVGLAAQAIKTPMCDVAAAGAKRGVK